MQARSGAHSLAGCHHCAGAVSHQRYLLLRLLNNDSNLPSDEFSSHLFIQMRKAEAYGVSAALA